MKIAIVRHFKVDVDFELDDLNWKDFYQWMTDYDHAPVLPKDVDLRDIDWNYCYSSSLPRAYKTAISIYDGEIISDDRIKEVDIRPAGEIQGLYDIEGWSIIGMDNWKQGTGLVKESYQESLDRTEDFLNDILPNHEEGDNILIVCHGLIMRAIRENLLKRDFIGEEIERPENGQLFLYKQTKGD